MNRYLEQYQEGFRIGDVEMVLGSLADDFVYDDPVDGRFTKTDFRAYLEMLFSGDEAADGDEAFETITDDVVQEKDGEVTAWAWFKTKQAQGAGLMKAGPDGVRLERLAYYTTPET